MSEAALKFYTISEVSKRLNVTYRTLHYYEEKLSLHITRNPSGDRIYTDNDIELLEAVLKLKSKGMTLAGIKNFLIMNNMLNIKDTASLTQIEQLKYHHVALNNELRDFITQQFNSMSEEISMLREQQQEMNDTLNVFIRQSSDHYNKFDKYITEWRNHSKKKPWFKKFFR